MKRTLVARPILGLIGGLCLIAPIVVKAVTYTHFVTPDGSSTSLCTQREPCSLTRAVALIGTKQMPPGSTVLVQFGADGIYSQAPLVFTGSGTAEKPIKFIGENNVRITGTRFKPEPSAWTRVPGRTYTYQLEWDEAATFTSGSAAQRPPIANWRPILVDDRRRPFTTPSGRQFALEFPPRYTNRRSIDQIETQHCTHWNDTTNNRIYVHTCDDGPPSHANNLYLSSAGWGTIIINGDYLWLQNIAIEHASSTGGGLRVNTSADHTVLKNIAARASSVNLRGTNTLAEYLDVSHVISQGIDPGECYDANPDFGVGECWNAAGQGTALLVGIEDSSASFGQVVRRAKVHRSWNGGAMRGPNTLEYSSFWGFANHTLGGSGTGGVIRHNVFLNGQDSIYFERNPFDDVTIEHNIFVNGALFRVGFSSGREIPAVALTKGFRFRHNVLTGIVYDDKVTPVLMADCNLFIRPSAEIDRLVLVTGTEGRPTVNFRTLEQIHAATPWETHSVLLPWTAWTDGTLFRRFLGMTSDDFDFAPVSGAAALEACGKRIGPSRPPPSTPSDPRIIR